MTATYLIHVTRHPQVRTGHDNTRTFMLPDSRETLWFGTYAKREAAEAAWAAFQDDPGVWAAVLTEWTPGRHTPSDAFPHHSYARRLSQGATETLLRHGARSAAVVQAGHARRIVVFMDWTDTELRRPVTDLNRKFKDELQPKAPTERWDERGNFRIYGPAAETVAAPAVG